MIMQQVVSFVLPLLTSFLDSQQVRVGEIVAFLKNPRDFSKVDQLSQAVNSGAKVSSVLDIIAE
jgi:hypothetical protein